MRRTILAAAAAFLSGGIATGAMLSQAQPAPAPTQQLDRVSSEDRGPGHWEHPGPEGRAWMHHHQGMRPFALIYRQPDRELSPADVQKIVEGFLLWNGNHAWKVTDVAPTTDGPIGFSLATPDGSVVAKFTMDPHSGQIARVG
ncbi:hypothetical protein [Rhodopila sp.]|uniref:hypothetical protein n=1 Tax=Rhodopila sp. TaxID=2480087 RepID=UPI003D0C5F4F